MSTMSLNFLVMVLSCSTAAVEVQNLGQKSIEVGGVRRWFVAYAPVEAGLRRRPTGLVVALHGAGMDGSMMCWSIRASDIVATTGAMVVCPTSTRDANPDALGKHRRLEKQRDHMIANQNTTMQGNLTKDKGENDSNVTGWKAFPGFDNTDDVNFLAALIESWKPMIPDGRVLMTGFSNGGSMAYRFNCEKSHLIDGLVIDGFVWTDPYKPIATPVSKPPYRQCEAANLTKKTPLYTVCGTEDVYCKALDFLGSWKDYSVGIQGCAGETKQVGHFPDHPAGAMTCYGYDSCPMSTACEISGQKHTGVSADDIHFAFGSFFNVTVEPLPDATSSNPPDQLLASARKKAEEKGKQMEGQTTSGRGGFLGEKKASEKAPADGSSDEASSSFHALLSGIVIVLAFANCAVAVWV